MTREEALDRLNCAYEVISNAPWSRDAEDIAEAVGVSVSTARRLMYRLADEGRIWLGVGHLDPSSAVYARVIRRGR